MNLGNQIKENIKFAHERKDGSQLALLYEIVGLSELNKNNIDSGCFFLTTAYIFALEEDLISAKKIHNILKQYGRDH